ncbi:heparin lyase I family protein [Dyadobacter sp. NIV53]|uniref:phage head spike fiber domain-containing protein n=1 Tax=Dyadobacter sp. NIV53 TaxID=2861765 RepID=UPI001C87F3B0|nr:heparin lyase I family protein [Dyadobacter sp. NIV53]
MNTRRDFLKKSSMAGVMLMAIPQFIIPKSAEAKSKLFKKLQPVKNFDAASVLEDMENISLTRSSAASYYNSNGFLKYTSQNSFTYSQEFANSSWVKAGTVVTTASDIIAPDGSRTTNMLSETGSLGEHRLSKGLTVIKGAPQTFSIYLKAGTRSKVRIGLSNSSSYTGGNPKLNVDLVTGTISSITSNVVKSSITDEGNGWWRVVLTAIPDLSTISGSNIYIVDDSYNYSYAGSDSNYIYSWGAQFEAAPVASDYKLTTNKPYAEPRYTYDPDTLELKGLMVEPAATNILKQSENFSDSSIWLIRNVEVQNEKFLSPNGISKAIKLVEDTTSNSHYIRPAIKPAVIVGQVYTFSIYIRPAERKWAYFNIGGATVHFDLSDGSVSRSVNPAYQSTNIERIGNGWCRYSATLVASTAEMDTSVGVEINENERAYKGNGAYGIYVWGPQLEAGTYASSYIPTEKVPVTRSAENCALLPPIPSSNDIMIQRTNGGTWVDNVSNNYIVPTSRYELQTGSFWSSGTTRDQKEDISQTMFPADYKNAGLSTTKLNIFGNDYRVQSPNKDYSVSLAKNKSCQQYKFQLNSGDQWSSDAGKDKERSELYSLDKMPFNQDIWLSYAVKVAPGDAVTSKFCHFGQFHATEDAGDAASVPVLTFRFVGEDNLSITTCANTDKIATKNLAGVIRYTGKLQRGVWVRNVMRIRFHHTNGQLQWWENGVEKLNLINIGMGNNDTVGPYWKFGIYRTKSVETLMVDYANMELSTTESLISRITNPLLIV